MDAILGIVSTVSFVLAFACAVACVVIFFRLQVRDAINFLRGKSVTAPSSKARGPRRDRSKKLAKDKKTTGGTVRKQTNQIDEVKKPSGGPSIGAVPSSEADTSLLGADSEGETGLLNPDTEAPTGLLDINSEAETGLLGADSESPTGLLDADTEAPTGLLGADSENPTGLLGADSEAETGLLNADSEQSTNILSGEGELCREEQVSEQASIPCAPVAVSVDESPASEKNAQEEVPGGVSIRDGDFFFVSKQHVLLVHTDEVID